VNLNFLETCGHLWHLMGQLTFSYKEYSYPLTWNIHSDNFLKICGKNGLQPLWTSRTPSVCPMSEVAVVLDVSIYRLRHPFPISRNILPIGWIFFSLQTELARLSETFVTINQTIRHHGSERRNGHDSWTVYLEKEKCRYSNNSEVRGSNLGCYESSDFTRFLRVNTETITHSD